MLIYRSSYYSRDTTVYLYTKEYIYNVIVVIAGQLPIYGFFSFNARTDFVISFGIGT